MIIVLDALNSDDFQDVLHEVHLLRGRVFQGRLGWEVSLDDRGREIDVFDGLDPAHVVSLDDEGRVVGCMRLLQTTGPHMMTDVFYPLLDGEPPLRDPRTWEATRFCVDTERLDRGAGRRSVSYVTSEVMIGAFEYAMRAGVTDAVAVIDPIMNRLMKRSGNAPYDYLGSPKQMGKVVAMAALMDASPERIARLREFAGIDHDVFVSEEKVRAMLDDQIGTEPQNFSNDNEALTHVSAKDILEYCIEQLAASTTRDETRRARELITAISASIPAEKMSELEALLMSDAL